MRFDKKTSGSFLETMPDRHNGQLSSRVVRTGFGLTYGPNRSYSALRIAGRKITFQVAGGLGPDCGCDTPQIYLGSPKAADSEAVPKKVLRAFRKTCEPAATISYTVTDRDVSNWSIEKQAYVITSGNYAVYVGSSSQDIHLTGSLTV
jgi:beta-glucosidase